MNNRIDAIYARQSVDKKDSISIESQIESGVNTGERFSSVISFP